MSEPLERSKYLEVVYTGQATATDTVKYMNMIIVALNAAIDRINQFDLALTTVSLELNDRIVELEAKYDKLAERHVTLVARYEGHTHLTGKTYPVRSSAPTPNPKEGGEK